MIIQRTLLACSAIVALSHSAASGGSYELSRVTINSGGGTITAADLQARTTLGQNLAGIARGDGYALQVGFWTASEIGSIFEDGFEETP